MQHGLVSLFNDHISLHGPGRAGCALCNSATSSTEVAAEPSI
jgi:hypothetical protein